MSGYDGESTSVVSTCDNIVSQSFVNNLVIDGSVGRVAAGTPDEERMVVSASTETKSDRLKEVFTRCLEKSEGSRPESSCISLLGGSGPDHLVSCHPSTSPSATCSSTSLVLDDQELPTPPIYGSCQFLKDIMTCCFCMQTLQYGKHKPYVLSTCLHTICQLCAEHFESVSVIECKLCFVPSPSLLDHHLVTALLSRHPSARNSRVCGQCHERGAQAIASSICCDCDVELCNDCDQAHRRTKATWSHCIRPFDVSPEENRCASHGKAIDNYCDTCLTLCCSECILSNHRSHQSCTIVTKAERLSAVLNNKVQFIKNIQGQTAQQKKSLQEKLDSLVKAKAKSVEYITEHYKSFQEKVRFFFQKQRDMAERCYLPTFQHLSNRLNEMTSLESRMSHFENFILQLIDVGDPSVIVRCNEMVLSVLDTLESSSDLTMPNTSVPHIEMRRVFGFDQIDDMMSLLLYDGNRCVQPDMKNKLANAFLRLTMDVVRNAIHSGNQSSNACIFMILDAIKTIPSVSADLCVAVDKLSVNLRKRYSSETSLEVPSSSDRQSSIIVPSRNDHLLQHHAPPTSIGTIPCLVSSASRVPPNQPTASAQGRFLANTSDLQLCPNSSVEYNSTVAPALHSIPFNQQHRQHPTANNFCFGPSGPGSTTINSLTNVPPQANGHIPSPFCPESRSLSTNQSLNQNFNDPRYKFPFQYSQKTTITTPPVTAANVQQWFSQAGCRQTSLSTSALPRPNVCNQVPLILPPSNLHRAESVISSDKSVGPNFSSHVSHRFASMAPTIPSTSMASDRVFSWHSPHEMQPKSDACIRLPQKFRIRVGAKRMHDDHELGNESIDCVVHTKTKRMAILPHSNICSDPSSENSSVPSSENSLVPSSENSSVPSSENSSVPPSGNSSVPSSGNSSVPPSGNSSVPSSENSSVPSSENSLIPSSENSLVPSSENSSVPSSENSSVPPSGNSTVPPSGNSSVPLSGNSSVPPSGNSSVPASENSSVPSSENSLIPSSENSSVPSSESSSVPSSGNSSVPSSESSSVPSSGNSSIPSSHTDYMSNCDKSNANHTALSTLNETSKFALSGCDLLEDLDEMLANLDSVSPEKVWDDSREKQANNKQNFEGNTKSSENCLSVLPTKDTAHDAPSQPTKEGTTLAKNLFQTTISVGPSHTNERTDVSSDPNAGGYVMPECTSSLNIFAPSISSPSTSVIIADSSQNVGTSSDNTTDLDIADHRADETGHPHEPLKSKENDNKHPPISVANSCPYDPNISSSSMSVLASSSMWTIAIDTSILSEQCKLLAPRRNSAEVIEQSRMDRPRKRWNSYDGSNKHVKNIPKGDSCSKPGASDTSGLSSGSVRNKPKVSAISSGKKNMWNKSSVGNHLKGKCSDNRRSNSTPRSKKIALKSIFNNSSSPLDSRITMRSMDENASSAVPPNTVTQLRFQLNKPRVHQKMPRLTPRPKQTSAARPRLTNCPPLRPLPPAIHRSVLSAERERNKHSLDQIILENCSPNEMRIQNINRDKSSHIDNEAISDVGINIDLSLNSVENEIERAQNVVRDKIGEDVGSSSNSHKRAAASDEDETNRLSPAFTKAVDESRSTESVSTAIETVDSSINSDRDNVCIARRSTTPSQVDDINKQNNPPQSMNDDRTKESDSVVRERIPPAAQHLVQLPPGGLSALEWDPVEDPLCIGVHGSLLYQPPCRRPSSPNISYCVLCWDGGDIVLCDVCERAYHRSCYLGSIDDNCTWQCLMCTEMKPPRDPELAARQSSMDQYEVLLAKRLLMELYSSYYSSLYVKNMENLSKVAEFDDLPNAISLECIREGLLNQEFSSLMHILKALRSMLDQSKYMNKNSAPHRFLRELDEVFDAFVREKMSRYWFLLDDQH